MSRGALEVAMPGAALALRRCVHPQERVDGLHNDPQLLPPRERLRRIGKVAHPVEALQFVGAQISMPSARQSTALSVAQ